MRDVVQQTPLEVPRVAVEVLDARVNPGLLGLVRALGVQAGPSSRMTVVREARAQGLDAPDQPATSVGRRHDVTIARAGRQRIRVGGRSTLGPGRAEPLALMIEAAAPVVTIVEDAMNHAVVPTAGSRVVQARLASGAAARRAQQVVPASILPIDGAARQVPEAGSRDPERTERRTRTAKLHAQVGAAWLAAAPGP